jgi:hypothetical protein
MAGLYEDIVEVVRTLMNLRRYGHVLRKTEDIELGKCWKG